MSFKVAISDVLIWNEALAHLPEEPVTNKAEQSLAARECRRWYSTVVAELLEMHHWGLATKRATLALITNDRMGEWGYAYAKPDDMAYPVMMGSVGGWMFRDGGYWIGPRKIFEQVNGVLYSSIYAGSLEYTSFSITAADFTALFKKAVALELAYRICMAITKDKQRAQALQVESEGWRQRVIANDLNRNQPRYGDNPTESEIARGVGTGSDYAWLGYRPWAALPAETGGLPAPEGDQWEGIEW